MVTKGLSERIVVGVCTTIIVVVSGCAINPQTGQTEFSPAMKGQFKSIFNDTDPCSNNDRNIGMAVGAVIGGVAGYLKNGKKGALVGVAVGTGGGALIGFYLDKRRCKLYKIAKANHLKLATSPITTKTLESTPSKNQTGKNSAVGLDVQLQNQGDEFAPETARLTPKARKYISEIAVQYVPKNGSDNPVKSQNVKVRERKVLIVAHSDESTDPHKSALLTQRRARAVAEVFKHAGVPARNIYYQGAGDTLPIASNVTSHGQAENKRIQIVDLPSEADLQHYLQLRQPNGRNFTTATKRKVAADTAPSTKVTRPARTSRYGGYDFGGLPLKQAGAKPIDLGDPVVHSSFSIISEAHAGESLLINSCTDDSPHLATPVRNLATGRKLPIRDYMPGFYGAPWLGGFHGNLVVVDKAYVPRDSGSPVPRPKLKVYKNYKGNTAAKPTYEARVPVNVYRGEKATLYRIFTEGPIQCIDFVKPSKSRTANVNLYYARKGQTYLSSGAFTLRK